jgi:hypothetical protein
LIEMTGPWNLKAVYQALILPPSHAMEHPTGELRLYQHIKPQKGRSATGVYVQGTDTQVHLNPCFGMRPAPNNKRHKSTPMVSNYNKHA